MSSVSIPVTPYERQRSKLFSDFVDILFGVVIGASFVFQSSSAGVPSWAANISANLVTLGDAVLAYSLVVTSWIGWHESIETLPTKNAGRFVVDVFLLFFYYLAFVNVSSFRNTVLIFSVVFALYCLWNIIRFREYRNETVRKKHRMRGKIIESGVIAVIFAAITSIATYFPAVLLEGEGLGALFFLSGGLLAVFRRNSLRGGKARHLQVFVGGPFGAFGSNAQDGGARIAEENMMKAIEEGIAIIRGGHLPLIPAIDHFMFLPLGESRLTEFFREYDGKWLEKCDALAYFGESTESNQILARAKELNLKIFYSIEELAEAQSTGR